jgi:hypothetical protein
MYVHGLAMLRIERGRIAYQGNEDQRGLGRERGRRFSSIDSFSST